MPHPTPKCGRPSRDLGLRIIWKTAPCPPNVTPPPVWVLTTSLVKLFLDFWLFEIFGTCPFGKSVYLLIFGQSLGPYYVVGQIIFGFLTFWVFLDMSLGGIWGGYGGIWEKDPDIIDYHTILLGSARIWYSIPCSSGMPGSDTVAPAGGSHFQNSHFFVPTQLPLPGEAIFRNLTFLFLHSCPCRGKPFSEI